MPNSEMTEHISTAKMELFGARGLEEAELSKVARHIVDCSDCSRQFVSTLSRQKGATAVRFTLAPEFWLRHEHIDYERLVEFADDRLEAADHELIDAHLKVCSTCKEDVRSFLAFREQIAPQFRVSYAPAEQAPVRERLSWVGWWRGLALKPIYSTLLIVLGIALLVGGVLLLNRRLVNQQARQEPTTEVSPGLTKSDQVADLSSPTISPTETPLEKPGGAEPIMVLNDGGGTITVDKSGNVTGLEGVSVSTRDEIAQVLISGRIDRPPVLKELGGQDVALRGSNRGQPFNLISPERTVIVSDRPTFKWESVSGASAYTVYINDTSGQIVTMSGELRPERREWLASRPLKRGEIYAWTVTTMVNGKEIVSPGPNSPEMKFQVLSSSDLEQLNQLKKSRSRLALAVFYVNIGMLTEAEREFQLLLRQNPRSVVIKKLLSRIREF